MILRVRDNGRGMSLKQVEEMNQKFSQPYDAIALRHQKEHGIGLDNINGRLQIFSHSNDRLVTEESGGKVYQYVYFTNIIAVFSEKVNAKSCLITGVLFAGVGQVRRRV